MKKPGINITSSEAGIAGLPPYTSKIFFHKGV